MRLKIHDPAPFDRRSALAQAETLRRVCGRFGGLLNRKSSPVLFLIADLMAGDPTVEQQVSDWIDDACAAARSVA